MESKNSKESGFSLLELIITTGLSSFIFIGSSVFVGQTLTLSIKQKSQIDLMDFKRITLSHLNNDVAFAETSNSTGFSCLVTNTCTAAQTFSIQTAYGSTYYDSTNPAQGLNEHGVICNSYPSADCSIRLQISFTDVCSSCDTKLVRINGELMASNLATDIIGNTNLRRFNFELIRNVSSASGVSLPIPPPAPVAPPPVAAAPTTPTPTSGGGTTTASNDPCTGRNAGDICENNDRGEIIGPSQQGGR